MKRIGFIHLLILILGSALCFFGSFWFAMQKTIAAARVSANAMAAAEATKAGDAVKDTKPEIKVRDVAKPIPEKWITPQKVAEELDGWRKDLDQREKKLLVLDAELLRRSNLLNTEEESLKSEREKLLTLQKDIEIRLLAVSQTESTNNEQVANLYSTMKPAEAAGIIRQLPDQLAAKLLSIMKPTKSAKIIEIWSRTYPDDCERLAKISDDMRLIVAPPEPSKVTLNSNP